MKQRMATEQFEMDGIKRLEGVIEADRFDPLRRYKMISKPKRLHYRLARISKELESDGVRNFILTTGGTCAVVTHSRLPSDVFGLNMGRVELLRTAGSEHLLEGLLNEVLSECRKRVFDHLSIYVDGSDETLMPLVQKFGFFMTSAQTTLLYGYRPNHPIKPVSRFSVRKFRPEDREIVFDIARESFSKQMRFHRDPFLDSSRVPELYLRWLDVVMRQSGERFGHVSLIGDEIVGFLIEHFDPFFYQITGVRKVGEALSGVREKGKGSYPALCSAALNGLRDAVDIHEAQCLLENAEVIRTLSAFDFQLVRSQYVMHRYLGEKE